MYNNFLSNITISTEEPMNGEHLHRALNRQDLEMLEKIINSGWVTRHNHSAVLVIWCLGLFIFPVMTIRCFCMSDCRHIYHFLANVTLTSCKSQVNFNISFLGTSSKHKHAIGYKYERNNNLVSKQHACIIMVLTIIPVVTNCSHYTFLQGC